MTDANKSSEIWDAYASAHQAGAFAKLACDMLKRPGVTHFVTTEEFGGFAEVHSCLISAVEEVREQLSGGVLRAFRSANRYPAEIGDWCESSYAEVALAIGLEVLNSIERSVDGPDAELRRVIAKMKRAGSQRPDVALPPYRPMSNGEALANFAKLFKVTQEISPRLPGESVSTHLWKEAIRATGEQRPQAGNVTPHLNAKRDAWLYERQLAGDTRLLIRSKLENEHPEWEQLATDQGVTSAVRRYCDRTGKPRPQTACS